MEKEQQQDLGRCNSITKKDDNQISFYAKDVWISGENKHHSDCLRFIVNR